MAATDVRTLVPRVRRATEGVGVDLGLSDDNIKDLVADAAAAIVLKLGSLFGLTLDVTGRDANGAPDEYETSDELTLAQSTVVACQAALDFFLQHFRSTKTSERISDEASAWEYALSPAVLTEILRTLKAQRDEALADVLDDDAASAFTSFLAVRDAETSRVVEAYYYGTGAVGGQQLDPRFG